MKYFKKWIILIYLGITLGLAVFPYSYTKADEISEEHISFNNTTVGNNATIPIVNNTKFVKDSSGKYVLYVGSGNKITYNLGIRENNGTMETWFKAHTKGSYIIASADDKNDAVLNLYINNYGKLELAVRDNNSNWKVVVTSEEIVNLEVWNYTAIKWTLSEGVLTCTIFLNDSSYTGSADNYKDFTGAETGIGCYPSPKYDLPLIGLIRDFSYYNEALDDEKIIDNMKKTTFINSYQEEKFDFNSTVIGTRGTEPLVNNTKFIKDENDKNVLDAGIGNRLIYDLAINSSGGRMGTWFKANEKGTYIIASTDDKNDGILDLYINNDGKLAIAVRDKKSNWKVVVTSKEVVKLGEWNYTSIKWEILDDTLNCELVLNDNIYTGTTSDFKDFTGAKTGIGCYPSVIYDLPFMGYIRDFTYKEVSDINERIQGAIPLLKLILESNFPCTWKEVRGQIVQYDDEDWYCVDVTDINKYLYVQLQMPDDPSNPGHSSVHYDVDLYSYNNGVSKLLATSKSDYNSDYFRYQVDKTGKYYIRVYSSNGNFDSDTSYTLKVDSNTISTQYGGEYEGWDYLGYGAMANANYTIPVYLDPSVNYIMLPDENNNEYSLSDIIRGGIDIWNNAEIEDNPKDKFGNPIDIFKLQSTVIYNNKVFLFNDPNDSNGKKQNTTATCYCRPLDDSGSNFEIGINYDEFNLKKFSIPNEVTNTHGLAKAEEILAHEFGHALGLRDLYVNGYGGIDNCDKLMFGYWNLQNLSQNIDTINYTDKKGVSIIQGWQLFNSTNCLGNSDKFKVKASASYKSVSESQLYNDSIIIVEGTVDTVQNIDENNQKMPISKIKFKVNTYFKDNTNSNCDIITVYQDGNSKTEFEGNSLMKSGQKYVLFLTKASDGGYMLVGGPQGIFDVLQLKGGSVVINHAQIHIKNYLDKIGADNSQIKYQSLLDFENRIRNTLISIEK